MKIKTHVLDKNDYVVSLLDALKKSGYLDDGMLGGGFPRQIAHSVLLDCKSTIDDYFFMSGWSKVTHGPRMSGDIDIFFPAKSEFLDELIGHPSVSPTWAGFAHDTWLSADLSGPSTYRGGGRDNIKVQLITHKELKYESVTSLFESFDIVNARYAVTYDSEGDEYILHYDPEALKCDSAKVLKIARSDCPFLALRVLKYMTYRGLESLHESSHSKISELCLRVLRNKWPTRYDPKCDQIKSAAAAFVKMQSTLKVMSNNDIMLFLGKLKIKVGADPTYPDGGIVREVDWAEHQLCIAENA